MVGFKTENEKFNENILDSLKPTQNLYRVMSIDRFFELVLNNKLVLVKPKLWDDPFENLLSKTILETSKGEKTSFGYSEKFYGQCWTMKKECDGIWRNYASLQSGVRIQANANKLLKVIYDFSDNTFSSLKSFIGKVQYIGDKRIKNRILGYLAKMPDSTGKESAKMLLVKRNEFNYEKEVRLLYWDIDGTNISDIMSFKIDSIDLIESIMFAPKTNETLYNIYKDKLINIGLSAKIISKSKLYDPFKLTVKTDFL